MPGCERMLPHQFRSRESRLYTENSVQQLMHSKQFQLYAGHMEYSRHLQLAWFVAPIGLTIALYYHVLFLLDHHEKHEVPATNLFFFYIATMLLYFFVAPCVVIAPFVGFFDFIYLRQVLGYVVLFTCINIAVTSYGGKWFHYPPYLLTDPVVPWFTGRLFEMKQLLFVTLNRVLPLQGTVVAGYLVHRWQQMRWERAWHIPFPLFSVPFLVGMFVFLWFCVVSVFLSLLSLYILFFDGAGTMDVSTFSFFFWQDIRDNITDYSLFTSLKGAAAIYDVWCATFTLSFFYFIGVLVSPVFFFLRIVLRILPTHPTTWGLMLILCILAASVLLRDDNGSIAHVFGLVVIICTLLYNGFVLTS